MPNYKSYVGVDQIYYALVTQDDANGYVAGTPAYLAPAMNVSQEPASSSKTQYADNQPFDVLTAEGETKVSCEITGLTASVLATLLGMTYDVTNARIFDNGGTPPYVALGFRAKKSDGTFRYFWFLKGRFNKPKEETPTQSDTADPKSVTLEFTAAKTVYVFTLVGGGLADSVKRVFGETSDANFVATTWWNAVQVPAAGAVPGFTCTPAPADNATGVAVSIVPTLTFTNALITGVTGILLTKNDGVIVATTITINAALKVITITPGANLTAAAKYLISVAGVRDVYGQAFPNTVYDFTCA
jgi:phi13 family phage major tail protein